MKLREFIGVFEQSERLRIVKDGKEIYTGYKALMEHPRRRMLPNCL